MKAKIAEISCVMAAMLIICSLTTRLTAQTTYTDRISLDNTGTITSSSGTGYLGNWYYYPAVNKYIMWFDNRPFSANSSITLNLGVNFSALSTNLSTFTYHTAYCWTNTKWSNAGDTTPPLPDYVQDESTFNKYIASSTFFNNTLSSANKISYSNQLENINNINPAWIGFAVSGQNVTVGNTIAIGVDQTPTVPVTPTTPTGACCNPNTGTCTLTTQANCPYNWLGEGTTCSSCQGSSGLYDYGDAPAPYPTLNSDNGARHYVVNGFYLGSGVTADSDGQPSIGASSDQKDDGVQFLDNLVINGMATIRITASSSLGKLSAWIDFNRDGDWADPGEKIFSDQPLPAGSSDYIIHIPATAKAGTTYARFRYSTNTGLSYSGTASDGEVEDYRVTLVGSGSSQNPVLPYAAHLPNQQYVAISSQPPIITDASQYLLQGYTNGSLYYGGPIIVDDWTAQGALPMIGLRWWGRFDNWTEASLPTDVPSGFHIGVWSNSSDNLPKTLIWEKVITNPAISLAGIVVDPNGAEPNSVCFEFSTLLSQEDWFYPTRANGTYWIGISAMYDSSPTHTWGWLARPTTKGYTAQQISYNGTNPNWPPTQGSQVKTNSLLDSQDMTFEIISSQVGGSSDLYDGWLGDLNGDGVANQQDFQDLIRMFVF